MHDLDGSSAFEWQDLDDTIDTASVHNGDTLEMQRWQGTPLQKGMEALYQHLHRFVAALDAAPPEIRVDYDVPGSGPLRDLRQGDYELSGDSALHASFRLRFLCVGRQRFSLRADSRAARDEHARWLNARGLDFHVEDAFGSQWHFTLLVRPSVPVSLRFDAEIETGVLRMTIDNLDALETVHRTVRAEDITPEFMAQVERMVLRRQHRLDDFTGNRVDADVRRRFRAAIDERQRERSAELGEPAKAAEAPRSGLGRLLRRPKPGSADTPATGGGPTTAPVFVGPRDDEGAIDWVDDKGIAQVALPTGSVRGPTRYAWLVSALDAENTAANRTKSGPPGAARVFPMRKVLTDGREFRLLDRDGHVAYTGRIVGEYQGMEPVEDFGLDHGCLRVEYLVDGQWRAPRGGS